MYRKSVLSNGLRVVSHDMKDRNSVAVGIWIGAGGRSEDSRIKGAAHYLEHILFKGSRKYSCSKIKESVEGVGGTLNAFTTEEQTCYFAKVPAKHFPKTLDILMDMVAFPLLAKLDIEKERGVILEEIKMYHDLPQYYVMELLEGLIWPDHPLGQGIAGTDASVKNLTQKTLRDFFQKYYLPNNSVIAAAGDVNHQAVVASARKVFGKTRFGDRHPVVPVTGEQKKARVAFLKKPIEQMHVALGMRGFPADHKDRYALRLMNVVLGANMSSRLFNEVREKRGLAYSIGSSCKSLTDTGILLVRAGVDNRKIVDAVALILKEFTKIRKKGITPEEFRRAKDYYIGQLQLGMEDSLEHMLWIGETTLLRDHIRTIEEVIRSVAAVRLSDVHRVAQAILRPQCYNLAVVGPLQKGHEKDLRALLL